METKKISINIFFAVVGFVLCWLLLGQCQQVPQPKIKTVYQDKIIKVPEIDTVYETNTVQEIYRDSSLVHDTIIEPSIQYITDTISKELLAIIAQKHYQINVYVDSIQIDSLGFILVKDSIKANRIQNRSIEYNLAFNSPDPRTSFLSAGLSTGGNAERFDLGIGLLFTTKNRWSFGYDYYGISDSHMITVKKSIFEF
jgi:hypothetical protein